VCPAFHRFIMRRELNGPLLHSWASRVRAAVLDGRFGQQAIQLAV
jgi:hypothetical protein